MRRALVLAAVTALAVAKPEMYKEKEDFQFSRSSSDDGTKSGYYGAQRGNMGGNYERAHNMDRLAQHQMGGLVRTVEGELGDGANQKTGSVYTAASSRGVYGSGHYDLSNLDGRNFQEGETFGSSQTQSSSHSAGYGSQAYLAANSAYGSHAYNSRNNGYHTAGTSDQALYATNVQPSDNLQSASQYDGTQAAHSYGYNSGYHGQSGYEQTGSNSRLATAYGSNVRLVSGQPVRVFVRPGGRVTIPVAAQIDSSSHGVSSTFDQNAINSETEVLGSNDQQTVYNNKPKSYESSYSYRKEWEKHDTLPVAGTPLAVPTVNPYPANSELYEDTQANGSEHQQETSAQESQNIHSSSQYRRYNVKSATGSQSRGQTAYNYNGQQSSAASNSAGASNAVDSTAHAYGTRTADSSEYTYGANHHGASTSNSADSRAYNHGSSAYLNAANVNNQVDDFGSKPRSYQSSYRYQKSWERQGDPYVIRPATNGVDTTADTQASQRLTASSLNQGASASGSHQYGSNYHQGYSSHNGVDCDEHGHIRVARSYRSQEDLGQQSQNLEDFSQQSQNLENFGQQPQNLVDFSQQSQNLENLGQQSQNLEDLGQQSQNLDNFGQQSQNLEEFGQQSQDLQDFGQQSQNLEDLSQHSQNLENFGQQSQNLDDFGQQTQNLELNQQSQKLEDFGQVQDAGQQTQSKWDNLEQSQQAQNQIGRIEELGQQTETQWDQQSQTDLGQQTQSVWSTLENIQHGNSGKDTERQLNGVEHTGYTHHGTNTGFQSQESTFGIEPSNTGHLDQEHNNPQNPFAHVVFNEQSMDQQQTGLEETDTGNQFTQSENVGQQQTHYFQTYMNQNNPNEYVPEIPIDSHRVRQDSPSWHTHQINSNPGYGNNQQTYFTDATGYTNDRINPGYNTNVDSQSYGYGSSGNTYSNSATHYSDHSTHSLSSVQVNESGSSSISNLWSLLDNIEKQTISGDRSDSHHLYNQENIENVQANSNFDLIQNINKTSYTDSKPIVPVTFLPSTTENVLIKTTTDKPDKVFTHDVERGDIGPENNLRPQEDVGRGDIGPDESAQNRPMEIIEIKPVQTTRKPFKTPEEIAYSITNENNKTAFVSSHSTNENNQNMGQNNKQLESDLSVLSLSDQKQLTNHNEEDNWKLQSNIQKITTPKTFSIEHGPEGFEQQNTDQLENSGQQVENVDQQSFNQFEGFDQMNVNLDQHNVDHQMVDFGQQSEHLGQEHMEQLYGNFNQQNVNLHQQDIGQGNIEEQGADEIQQQNMDQQFETSEQQQENQNPQSFNQFEELGHQSVNFGQEHQQLENFGQQSDFHQENLNNFAQHEQFQQESLPEFGQHNENLNQAQGVQQLENWSQTEDLKKQVQLVSKPNEDLLQQTDQVETFVPTSTNPKELRLTQHSIPREPVVEQEMITQKITDVDAPPEAVTEKPGFWNKVGSKFSSAKQTVSSWFKRS